MIELLEKSKELEIKYVDSHGKDVLPMAKARARLKLHLQHVEKWSAELQKEIENMKEKGLK